MVWGQAGPLRRFLPHGVEFEVWQRAYSPVVRDARFATATLPTARSARG